MITLLNTSIITTFGSYDYREISVKDAREIIRLPCHNCQGIGCPVCSGFGSIENYSSAIGHESTAEILSELLNVEVKVNRQNYIQQRGESALVFKLKTRAPEGRILSREEIEAIGYKFGLLARII